MFDISQNVIYRKTIYIAKRYCIYRQIAWFISQNVIKQVKRRYIRKKNKKKSLSWMFLKYKP